MRASIALILLGIFFVYVIYIEIDQDMASLLNERVKNAVNRATHDASLCIDTTEYSFGRIVFDQAIAPNTFKNTLALNLGLNQSDLSPKPKNVFTAKPTIEFIDYIDDNDGIIYPYLYENSTYGITKLLHGPSVISVVTIEKPVFCAFSAKFKYRKWAVYEYPIPK